MSQQKQCLRCGELLDSEVRFCTRCGADQYAAAAGAPGSGPGGPRGPYEPPGTGGPRGPYETPGPAGYGAPGRVAPPKNWFIESILATICCCLPLGIVAIVFAAKVEGQANRGDYAGAMDSAGKAKLFVILSIVLGLVGNGIYLAVALPDILKEAQEEMRKQQQQPSEPPGLTFPSE